MELSNLGGTEPGCRCAMIQRNRKLGIKAIIVTFLDLLMSFEKSFDKATAALHGGVLVNESSLLARTSKSWPWSPLIKSLSTLKYPAAIQGANFDEAVLVEAMLCKQSFQAAHWVAPKSLERQGHSSKKLTDLLLVRIWARCLSKIQKRASQTNDKRCKPLTHLTQW